MDIFNGNLQTRFTQLRQFISDSSFSREEVRYLRILLSENRLDIINELPIELVVQIAESLDLSDFAVCTAVSRQWREVFHSSPIISHFVNRFCPSLAHQPGGIQASQEQGLEVLLKIGRARHGVNVYVSKAFLWKYESIFQLDPEYHTNHQDVTATYAQYNVDGDDPNPDGVSSLGALYSTGKIAWRPKRHIVVVDSFWSRTRKVFSAPAGPLVAPELRLLAMGNQLIVGAMDRLLVAWDHVQNTYQEKKLPGSAKHATTEGPRVAVILYSGDVFLWEFGGSLKALSTVPLVNYHNFHTDTLAHWQSNLAVVFHPTCSRTFFLASAYDMIVDSSAASKRVVYEFNDTRQIRTFELGVAPISSRRTGLVSIRKLLPYRRDIIGFYEQPFKTDIHETFVEFDIYAREFTARVGEEFNHQKFGWCTMDSNADLDFFVAFNKNGYLAASYQPGFHF